MRDKKGRKYKIKSQAAERKRRAVAFMKEHFSPEFASQSGRPTAALKRKVTRGVEEAASRRRQEAEAKAFAERQKREKEGNAREEMERRRRRSRDYWSYADIDWEW